MTATLVAAVEAGLRADAEALGRTAQAWRCQPEQVIERLGTLSDDNLARMLTRLAERVAGEPARRQIALLLQADREAADILALGGVEVAMMGLEEAQSRLAWLQGRAKAERKGRGWM